MNKSYRIKANVGKDQVLNVNLRQDVDLYEILSLKLEQENIYKLHFADYGVIVGRVMANDAFGVPNAKVSVFIPLSEGDSLRNDLKAIYPYKFVTDNNKKGVKYNTLPNYKKFDCHQEVGSFPNKRLILDDDTILEVYNKYYKYTTITNNAGDYMIFGVPTGEQILHIDVDLSDIGILSQEPRDFIYKGYSLDMFESPTQFKKGTDLDNLPQIHNETTSVTVHPFWGDKNANEIAITRKDINLQYRFETTCVFIGSVITDNSPNSISYNCVPDENVGEASQLSPSKGNIEMIRKTIDDKVEEYPIKGNQLIDGDGVWCYQIPMNLDYVGMDEYGNIVPTDNPSKGIPTRARVRFRITLDETGGDSLTRHKARYLVPNNPDLYEGYVRPSVTTDTIDNDSYYEFGTLTPDNCFRDLYWNKVYSVKSYIPRLQMSKHEKASNYLAIKGVNKRGAKKNNPIPFNKLNLNFSIPAYHMLTSIMNGTENLGGFWRFLRTYSIPFNIDAVREKVLEEMDGVGLDFYNDWLNGCLYFPSWFWLIRQKKKYEKGESVYDSQFCECKNGKDEIDGHRMYLYNNCSLVYNTQELDILQWKSYFGNEDDRESIYDAFHSMFTTINFGSKNFSSGIIKKFVNKDGGEIFYYSFGNKLNDIRLSGNTKFDNNLPEDLRPSPDTEYYHYARLFSTDIILLGSLKDCDIDGIPAVSFNIPSTTSNIPPIGNYKPDIHSYGPAYDNAPEYETDDREEKIKTYTGMHWGSVWEKEDGYSFMDRINASLNREISELLGIKSGTLNNGLFFGLALKRTIEGNDWSVALGIVTGGISALFGWGDDEEVRYDIVPYSDAKTCVNAERISELGVTLDADKMIEYEPSNGENTPRAFLSPADGMITKRELEDIDSRALFATLNSSKLIGTVENSTTGYKTYNLIFYYPTNFDGRMEKLAKQYTNDITFDDRNKDYLDFRFGSNDAFVITTYRNNYGYFGGRSDGRYGFGGTNRYGGSRSDPNQNGNNSSSNETNESTTYRVDDVIVSLDKTVTPRTRHFYGYVNSSSTEEPDNIYPENRNRNLFKNYQFAFPLYDNSFYFYFGINQGSTAIDKFYEQFYTSCKHEDTKAFLMVLNSEYATACEPNIGKITVNVQEIDMPYGIELIENGEIISAVTDITIFETVFTGLTNGRYTIKVTDVYGNSMSDEIVLKYPKITLNTVVEKGISTEYLMQDCVDLCSNGYHAILTIDKYNLYGTDTVVNSMNKISSGKYDLSNKVRMEISYEDQHYSRFDEHNCSCYTPVDDYDWYAQKRHLFIVHPGTYHIKVYEMCDGVESDNVAYYDIMIKDYKPTELYINEVPVKYMIGHQEDLLSKYNKFFFNIGGAPVTKAADEQLKGWFGLHNPNAYADIFKLPLNGDDKDTTVYKYKWMQDTNANSLADIITKKMEYMFNLCKGAYITVGGYNTFDITASSDGGETLIRSALPQYEKFTINNTEKCKTGENFDTYIISPRTTIKASEASPNIVSENYRYVIDKERKFPTTLLSDAEKGINATGKCKNFSDGSGNYALNPKYEDRINKCANYFAAFSNNANIVYTAGDVCMQKTDIEPYKTIPYKTHDLYKDNLNLCTYQEVIGTSDDLNKYYNPYIINKTETTNRYFRAEFIDRRFDYDAFFITGRRCIHYDVENYEQESTWNMARVSALTYNGIEMLYDESKDTKIILSDVNDSLLSEYEYNLENGVIELKLNDVKKKFYDSRLYYGDGKNVNLIDGYQSKFNSNASAYYYDNSGLKKYCVMNDDQALMTPEDEFKNFGFDGISTLYGYPTKRYLDFYNVPYGDKYTYTNTSCSYDNLSFITTIDTISAEAQEGESVSFDIEGGELIKLQCNDFVRNCNDGVFNIKFTGTTNMVSSEIKNLQFRIDSVGSPMYRSKVEYDPEKNKLGLRVCGDVTDHTAMTKIKSAKTMNDVIETVISKTLGNPMPLPNAFDNAEEFKNHLFDAAIDGSGYRTIRPEDKFLYLIFDRYYYSQYADSLMKRIRVLNTSTVINVNDFGFNYLSHETVKDSATIPKDSIKVNSEGTYTDDEGTSHKIDSNGSNTQDVTVDRERDKTTFAIRSKYLFNCLNNACFNITYGGTTANYMLTDNAVGYERVGNDTINIHIIWTEHNKLLSDPNEAPAKIKVYLNVMNNFLANNDKGHVDFAFGFKIKGDSISMTPWPNFDTE